MKAIVVIAAVAAATIAMAAHVPVRQLPTFKSRTTVVEVSAVVTAAGETVTDLRADEVVLRDNGVEQPLVAFEYVDLLTPQTSSALPEPPATAQAATVAGRRDYVLVLDDLHVSPRSTKPTIDLANSLIDSLLPLDRLAIVNTGPHELVLQLSRDRSAARDLVRKFRGQKGMGSSAPREQEVKTLILLRVLKGVAGALSRDSKERSSVLLVSEGQPLGPTDAATPGDYHAVWEAYEDVVAAASLANVAIYAVNPTGLEASFPRLGTGSNRDAASVAAGTIQDAANSRMWRHYGTLGRISESTGGTLTVDTNDLASGLADMIRDSKQYYLLSYVQPEIPIDERTRVRTIDVSVTRVGAVVRARTTYLPRQ